jgi:orotate phosphoribosyltransferase
MTQEPYNFPQARKIASAALELGAIKLNTSDPFEWASGFRMPIYNDNRMFLTARSREIIIDALEAVGSLEIVFKNPPIPAPIIAGTSTAGIPWAAFAAEGLRLPMIYVRDKPKDHGLRNRIEGIDAASDLHECNVYLIEDLVSTGGSSVSAVQAIRDANGKCNNCISIFSYGFQEAEEMFQGKRAFDKEGKQFLKYPCKLVPLLTYNILLEVAKEKKYITAEQIATLEEWRVAPFEWGEKHGFPRVIKGEKK